MTDFATNVRKGLGFMIWQLGEMPADASYLADWLRYYGVNWISIKLTDGLFPYNQIGGNDKFLRDYLVTLWQRGIMVIGWSYIYPDKPGPEGALVGERVQKLTYITDNGTQKLLARIMRT